MTIVVTRNPILDIQLTGTFGYLSKTLFKIKYHFIIFFEIYQKYFSKLLN